MNRTQMNDSEETILLQQEVYCPGKKQSLIILAPTCESLYFKLLDHIDRGWGGPSICFCPLLVHSFLLREDPRVYVVVSLASVRWIFPLLQKLGEILSGGKEENE